MPEPRDTALTSGGDRLVLAAEHGLVPAIEELLAQGVQVNYRNHVFATALYCAVFHNHLPVVTSLLSHGADPNLARTGSFTPLHVASYRGDHVECARMLVDAGADTAVQDEMGKTALEHARLYRRPGVVAVLEEAENRPRPAWKRESVRGAAARDAEVWAAQAAAEEAAREEEERRKHAEEEAEILAAEERHELEEEEAALRLAEARLAFG